MMPPVHWERLMRWCCPLLVLLALLAWLPPGRAGAGMLVEATFNGVPVRAETGSDRDFVLVTVAGARHLVDVQRQVVFPLDSAERRVIRAGGMDDGASFLPYSLERWSAGPQVAGHASTYHVLEVDERICGEVLASAWMAPFIAPIIQSLELMQRVSPKLSPIDREACGAIPFTVYARNGWPLMAGWADEAAFLTQTIRFDHYPDDALFIPPAGFGG